MRTFRALLSSLLCVLAVAAQAQTSPNWTRGYVPTQAEWNALFASKTDWNGAGYLALTGGTLTGKAVTAASTTTRAGLSLPPGTAPTSPSDGDAWTTTLGMYVQINGSTVGPLGTGGSGGTPGGSNTQVQFNSTGTFAASANLTWISPALTIGVAGSVTGQLKLTGATSGTATINAQAAAGTPTLALPTGSGTLASAATTPIVLNATTGALTFAWTQSGNTTVLGTVSGALVAGNCLQADSSGNIVNAGAACGGGSGGSGTVTSSAINSLAWYAATGTVVTGLATANNGTLITSAGGVPSISSTLPATVQTNITAVGTITTGVWSGTAVLVARGGTGATTLTSNGILFGAGTSPVSATAAAASSVLITSAGNVPSLSTTLPATVQANITGTGTLSSGTASTGFTFAAGNVTVTGIFPVANLPVATSSTTGISRPDNTTIAVTAGVLAVVGGVDWLNVIGYGADPTGVGNSTTAINTAVTAMMATTGKCVYLPAGQYRVSTLTAITTTTSATPCFVGDSQWASCLVTTSATGDIISINGGTATAWIVKDLCMTSSVGNRTGGAYIAASNSASGFVQSVRFNNCFYCMDMNVQLLVARDVGFNEGQTTSGSSAQYLRLQSCGYGCVIDNAYTGVVNVGSQPAMGINIISAGAVMISNSNIIRAGNALNITPASGGVASVQVVSSFFDSSVTGILIRPTGSGSVIRTKLTQVWTSSMSADGVHVENAGAGTLSGIHISNGISVLNGGSGYYFKGATDVLVSNSLAAQNLVGFFADTNMSDWTAIGNTFGSGGGLSGNTIGGNIGTGNDHYIFSQNRIRNNSTNISNSSSGCGTCSITPNVQ